MKKMIVVGAAIVCAICARAASISWQYTGTGNNEVGMTVYLTSVSSSFESFDEITANLLSITSGANSATVAQNRTAEKANGSAANTAWNDGDTIDFYYVVVNSDKTGYWISDKVSAVAAGTGTPSTASLAGLQTIGTTAATPFTGGSDVPEPTSALLMLLGMAGLALKRKVA